VPTQPDTEVYDSSPADSIAAQPIKSSSNHTAPAKPRATVTQMVKKSDNISEHPSRFSDRFTTTVHSDTPDPLNRELFSTFSKPFDITDMRPWHASFNNFLTSDDVIKAQDADPFCASLKKLVTERQIPKIRRFRQKQLHTYQQYVVRNDILYSIYFPPNMPKYHAKIRIVIPTTLRELVIVNVHSRQMAHAGFKRTYEQLQLHFDIHNCLEVTRQIVSACEYCHRSKFTVAPEPYFHGVNETNGGPMEVVFSDIVGSVEPDRYGHKYIVTFVCGATGFFVTVPLRDLTAKTLIKAFLHHYIYIYGTPVKLITDNGSNYMSAEFKDFLRFMNIQHSTICPQQPQGNYCERTQRTWIHMLRTLCSHHPSSWSTLLPIVTMISNNSIRPNGLPSAYVSLYGRAQRMVSTPLEYDDVTRSSPYSYMTDLLDARYKAQQLSAKFFQDKLDKVPQVNTRIKPGLVVYARQANFQTGTGIHRKFQETWTGPYIVWKVRHNHCRLAHMYSNKVLPRDINISKLKVPSYVYDKRAQLFLPNKVHSTNKPIIPTTGSSFLPAEKPRS